jgi:hypothetical protein
LEAPYLEYAPLLAPQFFIGCESPKDVWVNNPNRRKKILVANIVKKEFRDIEPHDGNGLYLIVERDTQASRKWCLGGIGDFFS